MGDNTAVLDGFTREVKAVGKQGSSVVGKELYLLVRPDQDMRNYFKAWDMDQQGYIFIIGPHFEISDK